MNCDNCGGDCLEVMISYNDKTYCEACLCDMLQYMSDDGVFKLETTEYGYKITI